MLVPNLIVFAERAWANTLFGEFIIKVYHERPWVLKNNLS